MTRPLEVRPEARPRFIYWILLLGVLSISSSAILTRFAAPAGPGIAIAAWRLIIASALLLPIAIPKAAAEVRRFTVRERLLVLTSGVALGLHFAFWIESLFHTSVASSTVLATTSPIFLAILGFLILGERLPRRVVIAIGISVIGSTLIAIGDSSGTEAGEASNATFGNALALSAALFVSIYLLIGRVVRRSMSWLSYMFPLYATAALSVMVIALIRGVPLFGYPAEFYFLCFLMAVFPQIVGHGSFNYAVRYFHPALIGLLTLAEPVLASIAAYFLFGEVPFWPAMVGMGFVLLGVSLAVFRRSSRAGRAGVTKASSGSD